MNKFNSKNVYVARKTQITTAKTAILLDTHTEHHSTIRLMLISACRTRKNERISKIRAKIHENGFISIIGRLHITTIPCLLPHPLPMQNLTNKQKLDKNATAKPFLPE